MGDNEWHDGNRRTLGMYSADAEEAFLVWFHADPQGTEITLPGDPWGKTWRVVVHSGFDGEFPQAEEVLQPGAKLDLPGRSVVVLQAEVDVKAPPKSGN